MSDKDLQKLKRENYNLRVQLKVANEEIDTITRSKAYGAVRAAGHLKNQLKKAPLKTTKKIIRKIINDGISGRIVQSGSNLANTDDMNAQYRQWIAFNEPDAIELDQQRSLEGKFDKRPLISIITPVFNPPVKVFRELIDSVLAQTYTNFELCLGNFGDNPQIDEIINEYSANDSRIKSFKFKENRGIAENSNQILERAKGEYIALLDHDDKISKDALFENIRALNDKDYDFIYSDKDKIDESGNRFDPFFKPDWSPEIMLNANYLTHLNVMKTSIVKQVGGWDSSTDGAQDWDLFLKITETTNKIYHIQKVLYHWRVIESSTAMSLDSKPYALEGQRIAVDKHLKKLKIQAKTYHEGAELLIDWNVNNPFCDVVVFSRSIHYLYKFLENINSKSLSKNLRFVIFHSYSIPEDINLPRAHEIFFVKHNEGMYLDELNNFIKNLSRDNIMFFDDRLSFEFSDKNLSGLLGWMLLPGLVGTSLRISNHEGSVLDCGAIITAKGAKPIFKDAVSYQQAAIGNIEWIRNLTIVSSLVLVTKKKHLEKALSWIRSEKLDSEKALIPLLNIALSKQGRLVINSKIIAISLPDSHLGVSDLYDTITETISVLNMARDPYGNINLSPENPMRITSIEREVTQPDFLDDKGLSPYNIEAMAHAMSRDLSTEEIKDNQIQISLANKRPINRVDSVLFILPGFTAIYAGLNNIFSYATYLQNQGIIVHLAVLTKYKELNNIRALITEKFKDLGSKSKLYALNDNVDLLPKTDIAICTQWATAYYLARYNKTSRKCYFIQDKETSFYPMGTISALAENTYKFGFYALANTPGLLEWYKHQYGGSGLVIKSNVDLSSYSLAGKSKPKAPYKIFFYARPNEPRNAFELGCAALIKLKQKYKENVEIYAAGADWDPADYGLEKILTNLGKISYSKLPGFYRSMDVGLMMMFSGHPGVVASELMASGCPVVVNQYDDATWNNLYEHEKDCLVAQPMASSIVENIEAFLLNDSLRTKIIEAANKKVANFYEDYESSCVQSLKDLKKPLR